MSRVHFRLLTSKLNQLRRALVSLMQDFRPVWTEEAPLVREEMLKQFHSQNYGSWKPITKTTKIWRARHGYNPGAPPLEASGKLLRSLEGGNGKVELLQKKAMHIGSDVFQAATNQYGVFRAKLHKKSEQQKASGRGRKQKETLRHFNVPARPFIPDGTQESFQNVISRHMEGFLNRYIIQKMSQPPTKPTAE